jgi:hypothetical protein
MYFEAEAAPSFDLASIFTGCVESGADCLLLDEPALPSEFFDLSSGLAGELLHKLGTYRMRLAGVVPDPSIYSERFQDFLRETNKGIEFRFFTTRQEAVDWLEASA